MQLFIRIALLLAISSMAYCSALLDISHEHETDREGKDIYEDLEALLKERGISHHGQDREGKRIKEQRANFAILEQLLALIEFDDANCTMGQCLSQKECNAANGTEQEARCAGGFGVCCTTPDTTVIAPTYVGGDNVITGDGGPFFNPGDSFDTAAMAAGRRRVNKFRQGNVTTTPEPEVAEGMTIMATLVPSDDKVQIKIDIHNLNILGPVDGECTNDTLEVMGANPGLQIPILCGIVTDQQLYIDIDNSDGPYKIMLELSGESSPRTWNITIKFLTEVEAVPRRCLQYKETTAGTIESFNIDGDPPMALIDQTYTICFKYIKGFCDVLFNFERLDLGRINGQCTESNFLLIGDNKYCGDQIGTSMLTANATGSIYVGVRVGEINEIQVEGFKATYTMMPC
ncbi:unnamed protein product [Meganyctiphanes norvegica]|uniref:CUB domain-containing protein n=1 Tax=Meganyctiphanes norvegica TaxID=48144 RepID=A0AAV2Q6G9_MEGNR